ncbi:TPA: DUF2790 domain-containing protein [Pseudomonas putida]
MTFRTWRPAFAALTLTFCYRATSVKKLLIVVMMFCALPIQAQEKVIEVEGMKVPVQPYRYGMKVEMIEVLSISPAPAGCGVFPRVIVYRDAAAKLRALEYLDPVRDCGNDNG